jgi:hypothetical protein
MGLLLLLTRPTLISGDAPVTPPKQCSMTSTERQGSADGSTGAGPSLSPILAVCLGHRGSLRSMRASARRFGFSNPRPHLLEDT